MKKYSLSYDPTSETKYNLLPSLNGKYLKCKDVFKRNKEVLQKIANILDCTECTISDHTATHLFDIIYYINEHYDNTQD